MACFGGPWGKLGCWDMVCVCSGGSRCVLPLFWAAASGLGWGTAGVLVVDDSNMAIVLGGSIFGTGGRGMDWGGQGGV